MQLQRTTPLPAATDIAGALAAAASGWGHKPMLTVLRRGPDGAVLREEQSFASLAQWAAKGAHLLEWDQDLGPGDRLTLAAGAGWLATAVCLAAWWRGVAVDVEAPPTVMGEQPVTTSSDRLADCVVAHADVLATNPGLVDRNRSDVFAIGDEADGSAGGDDEDWAIAIQTFPDAPPTPAASAEAVGLLAPGRSFTQSELLDRARAIPASGRLALDGARRPETWIPAVLRPLVTGRTTLLLLDGLDREAAAGEGVGTWLGHASKN